MTYDPDSPNGLRSCDALWRPFYIEEGKPAAAIKRPRLATALLRDAESPHRRVLLGGDLFDHHLTVEERQMLVGVMARCTRTTFVVPTMYSGRMQRFFRTTDVQLCVEASRAMFPEGGSDPARWSWPLPNLWLGARASTHKQFEPRVPVLLDTPAERRVLWALPQVGPITLGDTKGIDWIVVGGDGRGRARMTHPAWVRSLRDQAVAAGVPFFFEGWGTWSPNAPPTVDPENACWLLDDGSLFAWDRKRGAGEPSAARFAALYRVGKLEAGYEIDGRTWSELPPSQEALAHAV